LLKDLLEFPLDHTFKIIGEDTPLFRSGVEEVFAGYGKSALVETLRKGKYVSFSVTLYIKDYEDMERIYAAISKIDGLKFYV
jgi:putative lipoic acid-binding regulatory protein